ncbi:hypothetical protein ACFL6I_07130 [candidate division KSB1 bacterium]
MEIQYLVKCPHCEKQQDHKLEEPGEVQCVACEKPFWIAVSGESIVHTHENKESVDRFFDILKKDTDPFAHYTCPHCGEKFYVKNYFKNIGRNICNHCCRVVYLVAGFNNKFRLYPRDDNSATIFDEDFGKSVEAEPE